MNMTGNCAGIGLFLNGRLVVYYSYQTDLGDGWEDPDVHNDPPESDCSAEIGGPTW